MGDGFIGAQMQPLAQHAVRRQPARADGVADDRQRIAANRLGAGQGLGRRQQVLQPLDAQHAGPAQRGLKRQIGRAVLIQQPQPRTDRHHRAQPGGSARGRQEQPMVLDPANIQQDRAGMRIPRQPVQRHAEADVGVGAQSHDMTKSHPIRPRPIHHRSAERRGL